MGAAPRSLPKREAQKRLLNMNKLLVAGVIFVGSSILSSSAFAGPQEQARAAAAAQARTAAAASAVHTQYTRYGQTSFPNMTTQTPITPTQLANNLKIEFVGKHAAQARGIFYGYIQGNGGPFVAGRVTRSGKVTLAAPGDPLAFPAKKAPTFKVVKQ
jgi:hypothetical protein